MTEQKLQAILDKLDCICTLLQEKSTTAVYNNSIMIDDATDFDDVSEIIKKSIAEATSTASH